MRFTTTNAIEVTASELMTMLKARLSAAALPDAADASITVAADGQSADITDKCPIVIRWTATTTIDL